MTLASLLDALKPGKIQLTPEQIKVCQTSFCEVYVTRDQHKLVTHARQLHRIAKLLIKDCVAHKRIMHHMLSAPSVVKLLRIAALTPPHVAIMPPWPGMTM